MIGWGGAQAPRAGLTVDCFEACGPTVQQLIVDQSADHEAFLGARGPLRREVTCLLPAVISQSASSGGSGGSGEGPPVVVLFGSRIERNRVLHLPPSAALADRLGCSRSEQLHIALELRQIASGGAHGVLV